MYLSKSREFPFGALPCKKKKLDDSSRIDVVKIARVLPGQAKNLSAPREVRYVISEYGNIMPKHVE
jgi:hypothetical protein